MKTTAIGLLLPVVLLGCTLEAEEIGEGTDEGRIGSAEQSTVWENALFPNALFPNALFPNALFPNALSPNALSPTSLPTSQLNAIKDPGEAGELSRMLLQYLVSCAFDTTSSFSFTWTDKDNQLHPETYPGEMGIAPEWATGPLTDEQQRWVSACIGARVNYYGTPVMISMRGDHPSLSTTEEERTDYSRQEGVFWGNMFDLSPYIRSCYNTTNMVHSRSKLRECAAGHLDGTTVTDCGPLGRTTACTSVCADQTVAADDPMNGFSSCGGITEVITVFLPN